MARRWTAFGSTEIMTPTEQAALEAARMNAQLAADESKWRGSGQWQDARQQQAYGRQDMAAQSAAQRAADEWAARERIANAQLAAGREESMQERADRLAMAENQGNLALQLAEMKYGREDQRYAREQEAAQKAEQNAMWDSIMKSDLPPQLKNYAFQQRMGGQLPPEIASYMPAGQEEGIPGPFETDKLAERAMQAQKVSAALADPITQSKFNDVLELARSGVASGDVSDTEFQNALQGLILEISSYSGAPYEMILAQVMPQVEENLYRTSQIGGIGGGTLFDIAQWGMEKLGMEPTTEQYLEQATAPFTGRPSSFTGEQTPAQAAAVGGVLPWLRDYLGR